MRTGPEADAAPMLARLRARLDPVGRDMGAQAFAAEGTLAPAAVLAPLIERDGALQLIFTERSPTLRRHAGQISFPGGQLDPGDADSVATALREAREEIGLDPALVEVLGTFEPQATITGYLVTPIVGLVRGSFAPAPDPREVASVFEAPFAYFMDPANYRRVPVETGGGPRDFYEIHFGARYIWGATARLLKSLHDRLYGSET